MPKNVTPSEIKHAITPFEQALERARHYANQSRAKSTWRAYEKDVEIFQAWCRRYGRLSLPADTDTVAAFISAEADAGKAVSTIRRRLSAIRLIHIANELPSPHESLKVTEVMRGIAYAQRTRPIRQAEPTVDDDIKAMVDALDLSTLRGLRDRALLLVGFDTAMRRSELVGVCVEHIEKRDLGLLIKIPFSKTDQHGETQQVGVLAREQSAYCPVSALFSWLSAADIQSGAVFRRIFKADSMASTALCDRSVSLILKRLAKLADLRGGRITNISGHSLRRGFVNAAADSGMGTIPITKQTRHKRIESVTEYVSTNELLSSHPLAKCLDG